MYHFKPTSAKMKKKMAIVSVSSSAMTFHSLGPYYLARRFSRFDIAFSRLIIIFLWYSLFYSNKYMIEMFGYMHEWVNLFVWWTVTMFKFVMSSAEEPGKTEECFLLHSCFVAATSHEIITQFSYLSPFVTYASSSKGVISFIWNKNEFEYV